MGMFDSFYDANGDEWQTKALGRSLERWSAGDTVPVPVPDCQIEVIGWSSDHEYPWSRATILGGVLTAVPSERDESLPLLAYGGPGATFSTVSNDA